MIAIVRVNLRRAGGDRRYLFVAAVFPVLFILVTGSFGFPASRPVIRMNSTGNTVATKR